MSTRSPFLPPLAVVAVAGGASLAVAVSLAVATASASATEARAGVVVPRPNAVVTRSPVRVVVRPPAQAGGLRVHLRSRDVTRHFRRDSRGRLVGRLTRRQGLRYGWNQVSVLTGRSGRPHVAEASSFVFARRAPGLVRLELRPGAVTSVTVRGGDPRQVPIVRARLNGQPVRRATNTSHPRRWTAQLSVTHGLRHGMNRLRLLVVEPDRGRHMVIRRRFRVRRSVHLAGAGWDVATVPGARLRLDGGRSRTSVGGGLKYRWRLRSQPTGSLARLRRADSRRPVLVPDGPGHYVFSLRVARRSGGALSRADTVVATVGPKQYLVPFKGRTVKNGKQGIQVGDTFHANPSPDGKSIQWLTLNRATLEFAENSYENSYLDGSEASIGRLAGQAENGTREQLVALAFPGGKQAIADGQIDAFKEVLRKRLGVPTPARFAELIRSGEKFSVVGIPWSGEGSGYIVFEGADEGLTGWLMPSATFTANAAPLFRLQLERPEFDTSVTKTARMNTMRIGGKPVDATLPDGIDCCPTTPLITGGFHVVPFDSTTQAVLDNRFFVTNTGRLGVPVDVQHEYGLNKMADYVRGLRGRGLHVAIQSIGTVTAPPRGEVPHDARKDLGWYRLAAQLMEFGANPHTFNTVSGSYAFVGGDELSREEVADSSSAVVTGGEREVGTLRGRFSMGHDGIIAPLVADATDTAEFKLIDFALQDPQPWPYTKGSNAPGFRDEEAPAFADALAHITKTLSGGVYATWGDDLRLAYAGAPNLNWSTAKTDLLTMTYPGDGKTCQQEPGPPAPQPPTYTRDQFCKLSNELQQEFTWLDGIKNNLFEPYASVFNASASGEQKDLQAIGKGIHDSLEKMDDTAQIGWSVGQFVAELVTAFVPEAKGAKSAAEALVAAYEFTREMVDIEYEGKQVPASDQVDDKVADLGRELANRIRASSRALVGLRQVIISDYGRLKALGSVSFSPEWSVNTANLGDHLDNTARASFSSELVPVGYGVHALQDSAPWVLQNTSGCSAWTFPGQFDGAPRSAWIHWMGNFTTNDGYVGWWPTLLVIGKHKLEHGSYAYPAATVTDPMFRPLAQNGYGMQLARFMWEQYEEKKAFPPTNMYICRG